MKNRRKDVRLRCENEVLLDFISIPGMRRPPKETVFGVASDVSRSGLRLTFAAPTLSLDEAPSCLADLDVPVGSVAKIRIAIPGRRRPLVHRGTVRWVKQDPGARSLVMGFELTHFRKRAMKAWMKYIEEHLMGLPR